MRKNQRIQLAGDGARLQYCEVRGRYEAANKTLPHMAGLNCISQVTLIHYKYIYRWRTKNKIIIIKMR